MISTHTLTYTHMCARTHTHTHVECTLSQNYLMITLQNGPNLSLGISFYCRRVCWIWQHVRFCNKATEEIFFLIRQRNLTEKYHRVAFSTYSFFQRYILYASFLNRRSMFGDKKYTYIYAILVTKFAHTNLQINAALHIL